MIRHGWVHAPEEQIKEVVGSGPFQVRERTNEPTGQAGRVRAEPRLQPARRGTERPQPVARGYLDKVIWRYIPDPMDAATPSRRRGGLVAGTAIDFMPKIEQNPDLRRSSSIRSGGKVARRRTISIRPSQQEGARGPGPHDGQVNILLGHRTADNTIGPAIRSLPAAALTRRGSGPSRS